MQGYEAGRAACASGATSAARVKGSLTSSR
jgi:hypothetical protein